MSRGLVLDGAPRRNGELVFEHPWQARAFGLAVALTEQHNLPWDDFRHQLMAALAEAPNRPYWESWLVALEIRLRELGIVRSRLL